jgi:sortase A
MSTTARRPTPVRRALRTLSTVMIVVGVILLADAGITLVWQEPVSAIYAHFQQRALAHDLSELEQAPLAPAEKRALARMPDDTRRLAFRARALERRVQPGDALGRIAMPAIGRSEIFVQGTAADDLRKGPGHYPATPLPGEHGTVGIAGHRTTYGAPFRHVDRLKRGNTITLTMPYGRFTYKVQGTRIVGPDALWIINRVRYDRLVLSACHPLYSASKRIVVFARLVSTQALGAAARSTQNRSSIAA